MQKYHQHFPVLQTPQSQPIPGSSQTPNNAGGFGWNVSDWERLNRFLILGAEGGTYYVGERELTQQNAQAVLRCIQQDGPRVVTTVANISTAGRAPKNDPALFVLAMCASLGNAETKKQALGSLPLVARIGTHLFHFVAYVRSMRGWGRGLRSAIANWYVNKPSRDLVYDVTKYQSRDGWSHRDLLRLSHPKPVTPGQQAVFLWAAKGHLPAASMENLGEYNYLVAADELLHTTSAERAAELIITHNLPRECVPTQLLTDPSVWNALLLRMPLGALVRNLGNLSKVGLLHPMSNATAQVLNKLNDDESLVKSRLHPLSILIALKQYATGHGYRGSGSWTPVPQVLDALDAAFYRAFKNVSPTGKRILIGVDGSGSMQSAQINNTNLTAAEAAAAMAMVTVATEPNYAICAFTERLVPVTLSPKTRLDHAIQQLYIAPEGTDGSVPIKWAMRDNLPVDAFILITDNESWAGSMHVAQALELYRRQSGIPAKLIAVSTASNHTTVADPNDMGSLNVVGFDAGVPELINQFINS